ncbi:hypothetical protein GCM10018987_54620 [Streptomyces cremeus]
MSVEPPVRTWDGDRLDCFHEGPIQPITFVVRWSSRGRWGRGRRRADYAYAGAPGCRRSGPAESAGALSSSVRMPDLQDKNTAVTGVDGPTSAYRLPSRRD